MTDPLLLALPFSTSSLGVARFALPSGASRDARGCSLPVGNNPHASELETCGGVGLPVGGAFNAGEAWLLAVHHELGLRRDPQVIRLQ